MLTTDYYNSDALLDRLSDGIRRNNRPLVFLVGSGITAPQNVGGPGVPSVSGIIDLIRSEFSGSPLGELDVALASSANRYQDAFGFLRGRRGQNVVNDVIKTAVWQARKIDAMKSGEGFKPDFRTSDDICRALDGDYASWSLTPAVAALGQLVATQADLFGRCVLTTNFDPLIEAAIGAAGGTSYRTVLHRDGDVGQTEASGCHVIHLHGYWYGSDTLHTPRQLEQERPRLKASLARILKDKLLFVCGYGGWADVFTSTLLDLIQDDREHLEVIWTFLGERSSVDPKLIERLSPGVDRGHVTLYEKVDCHSFLPSLAKEWMPFGLPVVSGVDDLHDTDATGEILEENLMSGASALSVVHQEARKPLAFDVREQDRPPLVDFYVGRAGEAQILDSSDAPLVFLTGMGGQGKSALAADYFSRHRKDGKYEYLIWRDCKEESERFEAQIASVVYSLLGGEVSMSELSQMPVEDIVSIFERKAFGIRMLLVFDNIDHYVDLEKNQLLGSASVFAARLQRKPLDCRVIFTCRPRIYVVGDAALEIHVRGIDVTAAKELFHLREVKASTDEVERAHRLTGGHPFWLDLIAAQVGRGSHGRHLDDFLDTVPNGEAGLPVATLRSIWGTLKEREQIVLRGLAETVRPSTVDQLANYLDGYVRYNQFTKAIKYLRGINLIVVKPQGDNGEALELHPLIRAFVRQTFAPAEQVPFVESILKSYLAFLGIHKSELNHRPRLETIERWLEAAEVCAQAGRYEQSFEWLNDVRRHVGSVGRSFEFVRIAEKLVRIFSWKDGELPKYFDGVFSALLQSVSIMGRANQALNLFEIYRDTIPNKSSRYINYCDMMCYYHWVGGDFFTAAKWGVEGVELKRVSGVDTAYDASHNLALAQRDSGAVDVALKYFLKGQSIEDVLDGNIPEMRGGGAYYGNIGRCLQLMGQVDQTLTCYRRSASLIEDEISEDSVANRGYIRQWVGELLYAKGDRRRASACFLAAITFWDLVAPPKAEGLRRRFSGADGYTGLMSIGADRAEKIFLMWIRGTTDAVSPAPS